MSERGRGEEGEREREREHVSLLVLSQTLLLHVCILQALGTGSDSCQSYKEETVSDSDGNFHFRGLMVCVHVNVILLYRDITSIEEEETLVSSLFTQLMVNKPLKAKL